METLTICGDIEMISLSLYNRQRGTLDAPILPELDERLTEVHEHEGWLFYRTADEPRYQCCIDGRLALQLFDAIEEAKQAIEENL